MGSRSTGQNASGEGVISLGSEAWNIADGFTKIKILRLLIQLDLDEEISMFGKKDETDYVPYEQLSQRRVEAFEKMIFHLKQLIGNCRFALEKGSIDEEIVTLMLKRISVVEEYTDGIADWRTNDVTKENILFINEKHFKKCFDVLRSIKDELNFPINRAGLIFKQGETMDIEEMMRSIEQGE
jgi:hypothetical protein